MDIHENLKQLYNLITKQINISLENFDLTFAQSSILLYVIHNQNKKINQRQIENEFSLTNPTVNGILNRLEKKKLIMRETDDEDKRIKFIKPLPSAYDFLETIKESKSVIEKSMTKNINEKELKIFNDVIKKMNKNIKESSYERNI